MAVTRNVYVYPRDAVNDDGQITISGSTEYTIPLSGDAKEAELWQIAVYSATTTGKLEVGSRPMGFSTARSFPFAIEIDLAVKSSCVVVVAGGAAESLYIKKASVDGVADSTVLDVTVVAKGTS